MTEYELNLEIDDAMQAMYREVGAKTSVFSVPDYLMLFREMTSGDAFYVAQKMEEYGLAERQKWAGDLLFTTFGREVIRDGGWLVYLQKLQNLEDDRLLAEKDESTQRLRQENESQRYARYSMWGTVFSAVFAAVSVFVSIRPNSNFTEQISKMDSLQARVKILEAKQQGAIQLDNPTFLSTRHESKDSLISRQRTYKPQTKLHQDSASKEKKMHF